MAIAKYKRSCPEISVIIPTLNEEKYIEACLSSLKKQKCRKSYEIIIGDGKSTDRTLAIAKKYGAKVVFDSHNTPSGGRYAAAKSARGKIFAFINADSTASRDWLRNITRPFSGPGISWAMGPLSPNDGDWFDAQCTKIINFFARHLNKIGITYSYADNFAARAGAYRKCGGFDPNLTTSEDTDLSLKLKKIGGFAFASDALVKISMRRVKKWGRARFVLFHTKNFLMHQFFSKSSSSYEPVR